MLCTGQRVPVGGQLCLELREFNFEELVLGLYKLKLFLEVSEHLAKEVCFC